MRKRVWITGSLVPLVAVAAAFLIVGPERFWRIGGDPDLGPIAFETLSRRTTPNDALACPPDLCAAHSDLVPPVYSVPARELRAAFAKMIATEPLIVRVATDETSLTERYIQRSRWLGFPDTVVVQFLERPAGGSTLALYSRSKFGAGDLGVNKARLARWLAKLSGQVATR